MNQSRAKQILELATVKAQRSHKPLWMFFPEIMDRREMRVLERYQRIGDFGDLVEALMAVSKAKPILRSKMAARIAYRYLYGGPPVICYAGPMISSENTSINAPPSPALKKLTGSVFKEGQKVLDYGAGKFARNADYLRDQGIEVYAYDPYNGTGEDGWGKGVVSSKLPQSKKFDVAFTSFVLNTVSCDEEKKILAKVSGFAPVSIHVVRNTEIFDAIKAALVAEKDPVFSFFKDHFIPEFPMAKKELDAGKLTDDTIMMFCRFGVQTSRGFQRIPHLENFGYSVLADNQSFKTYKKG